MASAARTRDTERVADGAYRTDCPVCNSTRQIYRFISRGYPVTQCQDCQLLFRNPRPSDQVLSAIYTADYFLGDGTEAGTARVADMKQATARFYLDNLEAYRGAERGRLIDLGCGCGELLMVAQQRGYEVAGQEVSPDAVAVANARLGRELVRCGILDLLEWEPGSFDVCVLADVIEHVVEPLQLLRDVSKLLKPGGTVLLVTPSLQSWSARLMKQNWMEFKVEHLTFFSPATLETALAMAGFRDVRIDGNQKVLTPEYVHHHFQRFRVPLVSTATGLAYELLPRLLRERQMKVVASGIRVLARAQAPPAQPLLSIIVPVYNERQTFSVLMDALVQKDLPGLDREIIIVESSSTDGTRQEVLRYQNQPGVRLVLESEPRGKGHAVRAGLARARGDFVLIQDADLEYDLNDYDALLEPLLSHRAAFVLGTRHGGSWKMRRFTDNPGQALLMNLGHLFFTWLVNTLYGQRMQDPFTMFKVFRRDCLYDLELEQNRFGFDFELVIKLVRKGYTPLEVPVNYRSRSFSEGKKVRIVRDPLEWLWVVLKYRLLPSWRWRRSMSIASRPEATAR